MQQLAQLDGLVISQKRSWEDLFVFFNVTKKFSILDTFGNQKYFGFVRETSFPYIKWLKKLIPLKIVISNQQNQNIFVIYKKMWFLGHKAVVYGAGHEPMGTVRSTMNLLAPTFIVHCAGSKTHFEISSNLLSLSVFEIRKDGNLIGKISREWPGRLKNNYDENNFGMTFPAEQNTTEKSLLLAALLLISTLYFDKKYS